MDPTLGEEEEEEEEEEVMRDSGNGGRQDAILSVACMQRHANCRAQEGPSATQVAARRWQDCYGSNM